MPTAKISAISNLPSSAVSGANVSFSVTLQNVGTAGYLGVGISPYIGATFSPNTFVEVPAQGYTMYEVRFTMPPRPLSFNVLAMSWVNGITTTDESRPVTVGVTAKKSSALLLVGALVALGLVVISSRRT